MTTKTGLSAKVIGEDSNVFSLAGIVSSTLRKGGFGDLADEMFDRVTSAGSYSEALNIMQEYVEFE